MRFPRRFDSNAKSLVKHLLVADLSKRFGNLKRGSLDIKHHRWFQNFNWQRLLEKSLDAPYRPTVTNPLDTSNFGRYPESADNAPSVHPSDDPFINW